jgi:hypothetical protein
MNLYFLSLLESTLERRKNIALIYKTENKFEEVDVLSRFPFLGSGDIIRYKDMSYVSMGDELHPFFYKYEDEVHFTSLSSSTKERLKKAKYEEGEDHLIYRNFRIFKMKFDLFLLSSDEDDEMFLSSIKDDLENGKDCSVYVKDYSPPMLLVSFY